MPLRGRDANAPEACAGRAGAALAARLTFHEVELGYAAVVALAGFSLDVARAQVVCLLGPSGCGKPQRIAAGIERPTVGAPHQRLEGLGSKALRAAREAQRRVSFRILPYFPSFRFSTT